MRIKRKILVKLSSDEMLSILVRRTGKSYSTIYRWVRDNHVMLTTAEVLEILRDILNLTDDQILERTKKPTAA